MKYDRPVHELFGECARALPRRFQFRDVEKWFAANYPDVSTGTLRVHLRGLSVASTSNPYPFLAEKRPLFRNVSHGVYEVLARSRPRDADDEGVVESHPHAEIEPVATQTDGDILLVSCVKTKLAEPAAAKDLYVSALFRKARAYAERRAVRWLILSAEYGLVAPDEWITPYERYLPTTSIEYRDAWGEWVVRRLELLHSPLAGRTIEIHASAAYATPLRSRLEALGARVVEPLDGLTQGERLHWYGGEADGAHERTSIEAGVDEIVEELTDYNRAVRASRIAESSRDLTGRAGLYSWWVDPEGAADLSAGTGLEVEPGLIYAGRAGATRWPNGKASTNDLASRLIGMHVRGRAMMSTFRHTLGAILWDVQGLSHLDDPALGSWIREHLWVVALPIAGRDRLEATEHAMLVALDPP
ncbi:MAG: hypothetical protein L0K86_08960 [Actinomycetia bacterium]|nr:hypothetical protein [Actinomycetes bacterium]